MPYAKHEDKLAAMKVWRKRRIGEGYGKWLYARRKLRYDDAVRFRAALEVIVETGMRRNFDADVARSEMLVAAQEALRESAQAEAALGEFAPPTSGIITETPGEETDG